MNTITTDLETLRKNIREENNKARSVARKSLEHVRNCGNMLIELKARAQHGSFQYELKELGIEQRTANNYMRIATNWKHVSTLNHGVRDALKLLARVDDPPPTPATKARTEVIEAEVIEQPEEKPVAFVSIDADWLEQKRAEHREESKIGQKIVPSQKDATPTPEPQPDELPSWNRLATQFFVLPYADKVAFLNHINSKFKP